MDEFKPAPDKHTKINSFKKKEFPLLVIRHDCWFFDWKCPYLKTFEEIEIEIKKTKYWMNEHKKFGSGYTCAPIYTIPHPDHDSFCFMCTRAMDMRRDDPKLGYGKPRREERDKDEPNVNTALAPSKCYKKGSKYDPILDAFMEGEADFVEVSVRGIDANYLGTQLNRRIKVRRLRRIKVLVVNNVCYLEKV